MRYWQTLGLLALALASAGLRCRAQTPAPGTVVVIPFDDTVNTVSAEYVTRGLQFAAAHQARAVVLELNTPGGLDTAMRAIIQGIFASPVPVIGYVAPSGSRAASAGFYILLSCDVAAMAPGTNAGAAHPVILGGAQPDKIEAAKMENDASAFMRSIATRRGRNLELAEKGVIESQSFTTDEALQGHLVDLTAPTLDQLLQQLTGRAVTRLNGSSMVLQLNGAPQFIYGMSLRERVLDMDPNLAFILLVLGGLLIYVEFSHPGMMLPGVIGVILVVLALFCMSLLPINGAGAGLLLLGLVFFVLEIKFTTHGALAAGGIACLALGAILLIDAPVPQMRIGVSIAISVALGFGVISTLLLELVLRARRHRVVTGAQGLIGEIGIARTALAPVGKVAVHGEVWEAVAAAPVDAGAAVRVRAVRGLQLEVEDQPDPK